MTPTPKAQAEAMSRFLTPNDERIGMAWWNELSGQERVRVLVQAVKHKENASVADAFEMWRQGIVNTDAGALYETGNQ